MADQKEGQVVEGIVSVGVAAAPGSVPVRPVDNVRIVTGDGQQQPTVASAAAAVTPRRSLPQSASVERPEGALMGRAQILALRDKPKRRLFVKAMGGVVCVQALSSMERDSYERALTQVVGSTISPTTENIRAKLVARSVVDENGTRCFSDEDAMLLGELPAAEMEQLWQAASYLSAVTNEDVKELAGNSVGNRGDSSA